MKIYERQEALRKESYRLRNLDLDNEEVSFERAEAIRKEQDELYKKWLFYKNFSKALYKQQQEEKERQNQDTEHKTKGR